LFRRHQATAKEAPPTLTITATATTNTTGTNTAGRITERFPSPPEPKPESELDDDGEYPLPRITEKPVKWLVPDPTITGGGPEPPLPWVSFTFTIGMKI